MKTAFMVIFYGIFASMNRSTGCLKLNSAIWWLLVSWWSNINRLKSEVADSLFWYGWTLSKQALRLKSHSSLYWSAVITFSICSGHREEHLKHSSPGVCPVELWRHWILFPIHESIPSSLYFQSIIQGVMQYGIMHGTDTDLLSDCRSTTCFLTACFLTAYTNTMLSLAGNITSEPLPFYQKNITQTKDLEFQRLDWTG